MATLASVDIVLGLDTRELKRDLDKTERRMARLQRLGTKMKSVGRGITAGITVPFAAASAAAVKMAADAEETRNLFRVAMGDMIGEARTFSREFARATELDPVQMQETVGTFQQMFTAMGIARDRAFEMSKGLTRLKLDIASFFNLRPEEAFQKLQSGIVGEIEPLRRLGVLVDQQTIKQVALNKGLIKTGEEMTQQQKVVARYMAILKQTDNIQGDFLRTQDQLVNQLRILKDQAVIAAREFGKELIPAARDIVSTLKDLVKGFADLRPETKEAIVKAAALAAALGPLLLVAGQLTQSLAALKFVTSGVAVTFGALATTLGVGGILAAGLVTVVGLFKGLQNVLVDVREQAQGARVDFENLAAEMEGATRKQLREFQRQSANMVSRAERMQTALGGLIREFGVSGRKVPVDVGEKSRAIELVRRFREEGARLGDSLTEVVLPMTAVNTLFKESIQQEQQGRKAFDAATNALNVQADAADNAASSLAKLKKQFKDIFGFGIGTPAGRFPPARLPGVMNAGPTRLGPGRNAALSPAGGATLVNTLARSDQVRQTGDAIERTKNLLSDSGSSFKGVGNVLAQSVLPAMAAVTNASDNMARALLQAAGGILQALSRLKSVPGPVGVAGGILGAFAGFFHRGGTIPGGQFGLVGESGPEFVAGPATVSPGGFTVTVDASGLPPAQTPFEAARDQQWQALLDESARVNRQSGGELS